MSGPGIWKNLRLTFHSSVKLSIPRSPFRPAKPRYARFDNWPSLRSRNEKFSLRNEKFAFDFSYSWTLTFQPYRTYILKIIDLGITKIGTGRFLWEELFPLSPYSGRLVVQIFAPLTSKQKWQQTTELSSSWLFQYWLWHWSKNARKFELLIFWNMDKREKTLLRPFWL